MIPAKSGFSRLVFGLPFRGDILIFLLFSSICILAAIAIRMLAFAVVAMWITASRYRWQLR